MNRHAIALAALLLLPGAAQAQSTDPTDAFNRVRVGDPGFGPSSQGAGNCFTCHKFTKTSSNEAGGHANVYRSAVWLFETATSELNLVRRFPPTPNTLPPTDYRVMKFSPLALFGDALSDPTLGGVTDAEVIAGGAALGRPIFTDVSELEVGRFGWQPCCRTLDCQIRKALDRDFGVTEEEQASQQIHTPSGLTWEQFYDWEVGLLVQAIQGFEIPPPTVSAGDEDDAARGEALFQSIGCADCHRMNVPLPGGGTFDPFTDWRVHKLKGIGKGVPTCLDVKGNEVMTPSLISRRNFLGHDMNTNPSIQQDVVRVLHNIDDARPAVEAYLNLTDEERGDVDVFVDTR
jgi:cytochrome c2